MIPGTTDAALSPDIPSLNNPGPGLPNYTSAVLAAVKVNDTKRGSWQPPPYIHILQLRLVIG